MPAPSFLQAGLALGDRVHQLEAPATRPYEGPASCDLSGRRFGRLTVFGLHGVDRQGCIWVVRCSCGVYELRRTLELARGTPLRLMCLACDRTPAAREERAAFSLGMRA